MTMKQVNSYLVSENIVAYRLYFKREHT